MSSHFLAKANSKTKARGGNDLDLLPEDCIFVSAYRVRAL